MNKVQLVGRVATDPQIRTTGTGVKVADYRIAVRKRTQDKENNTDFFTCVAWRTNAEFTEKYIHKGSQVAVDGHLENNEYTDQQGNKRQQVRIVVDGAEFVGGRQEQQNADPAPAPAAAQPFQEVEDQNLPF